MTRARRVRRAGLFAVYLVLAAAPAAARTMVTTYTYNADGAPTAATTHVDGGAATTTYLTWANFVPDAATPARGTVRAADATLRAIGSQPQDAAVRGFAFDQRDRVVACQAPAQRPVAYTYHPASMLAAATPAGGDGLAFYYDTAAAPQLTNLRATADGATSSFLGPLYYPGNGAEQALLRPRQNTAGLYAPATQQMTPLRYEPYGASATDEQPASGYGLEQAPLRYAGEYEDPVCGTYYLRARWYLVELQTFLSRDVGDPLQRFGYTGGNPITRTDPTGLSWYSTFQRGTNRFLSTLGAGGTALSLLPAIGEAMFALQLAADGGAYFHNWRDATMLALGGATLFSGGLEATRDVAPLERWLSRSIGGNPTRAFGARVGIDAAVGAGQSVLAGFAGGRHRRFDATAFVESIGATAATMLIGRAGLGLGYRPFSLSAADIDRMASAYFADYANPDDVLLLRMRVSPCCRARAERATAPFSWSASRRTTGRRASASPPPTRLGTPASRHNVEPPLHSQPPSIR